MMTSTENLQHTATEMQTPATTLPVNLIAGILTTCAALAFDTAALASIGLGLFAYTLFWFVNTTGKEIAIGPVISMIATAQWLLGPYFAYYHDAITYKYRMYVDEETYFLYVVPSLFLFVVAIRTFSPILSISQLRNYILRTSLLNSRNIYYIFAIGAATQLATTSLPFSLRFILFLISQFTFIASIYMMVLRMRFRWICLGISFFIVGTSSLEYSLFHIILLWSTLIASYICAELRISFGKKILFFTISILLVAQLQAAKSEYRLRITQDPGSAGIFTLMDAMVENSLFQNSEFSSTSTNSGELNARLNQGWIISAAMNHVPAVREFENGETIFRAFQDSFLPRFLFEKRAINVSDGFEKYTGLRVSSDTSFGISVVGEAWVNFGYYGIIFMGAFGIFYAFILRSTVVIARGFPTVIFWIPLIFLQATKAETETVVVLNHIVKSGVLVAMFYFFAYKVLKWRI